METVYLSERAQNAPFLSYLYNAVLSDVMAAGGRGELVFAGGRAAVGLELSEKDTAAERVADAVTEVLCIGYKQKFLRERLCVSLSARERGIFIAALIAADFAGDAAFVRARLPARGGCAIDGVYAFRLAPLREKWERIVRSVPASFSSRDLVHFCGFLASESRNKIYLKGRAVYGQDLRLLRRSRLLGEEDAETEIVLSDAGCICCLGDVEHSLGDFLQKYYAQSAIFS